MKVIVHARPPASVASCLAAAWGTSRLTPLAGAGYSAASWQEAVVQAVLASLGLAMLAGRPWWSMRFAARYEGAPRGFLKLAWPLITRMARRQQGGDMRNLKELMEARAL